MSNPLQDIKFLAVTAPGALVDDASLTTTEIDTAGYDYLTIVCHLGATDIAMTALAVTQSATAGSGHANITGLVWGTSANIEGTTSALPSATDDNTFQVAQVDLRGKERYIDVTATVDDGTVGGHYTVFAILSRHGSTPTTLSDMGCNEVLRA